MQQFFAGMFIALVVSGAGRAARADDAAVNAILDKAIKALGGEANLSAMQR